MALIAARHWHAAAGLPGRGAAMIIGFESRCPAGRAARIIGPSFTVTRTVRPESRTVTAAAAATVTGRGAGGTPAQPAWPGPQCKLCCATVTHQRASESDVTSPTQARSQCATLVLRTRLE